MTQAVAPVVEPAFLTFLKRLADDTVKLFNARVFTGQLNYSVIKLADNLSCIEMQVVEDNGESAKCRIFLGRRYYGCNMVRVENMRDSTAHVMEADPAVLLSYVTLA